ncbi:hypothetical protein [Peribacillus muralis]|uniref:hypothetical protein n=1 Tax=Peribacillus muralis TaxID=264697 RepID=UPI003D0130B8
MKKLLSILLILVLSIFFIMMGCSTKEVVYSNMYSFTLEEQNQLTILAYESLDDSLQNDIIDSKKGEITGFKSSGEFKVFTGKNKKTKDINNIETIVVTFAVIKDSKLKPIQVYLNHNREVLGFITKQKGKSSS